MSVVCEARAGGIADVRVRIGSPHSRSPLPAVSHVSDARLRLATLRQQDPTGTHSRAPRFAGQHTGLRCLMEKSEQRKAVCLEITATEDSATHCQLPGLEGYNKLRNSKPEGCTSVGESGRSMTCCSGPARWDRQAEAQWGGARALSAWCQEWEHIWTC